MDEILSGILVFVVTGLAGIALGFVVWHIVRLINESPVLGNYPEKLGLLMEGITEAVFEAYGFGDDDLLPFQAEADALGIPVHVVWAYKQAELEAEKLGLKIVEDPTMPRWKKILGLALQEVAIDAVIRHAQNVYNELEAETIVLE